MSKALAHLGKARLWGSEDASRLRRSGGDRSLAVIAMRGK
jgi:hypothetical protein